MALLHAAKREPEYEVIAEHHWENGKNDDSYLLKFRTTGANPRELITVARLLPEPLLGEKRACLVFFIDEQDVDTRNKLAPWTLDELNKRGISSTSYVAQFRHEGYIERSALPEF